MTPPQPRPALRRADDASVHPALSIAPSQAQPATFTPRTADAVVAAPAPGRRKKGKQRKDAGGRPYRGAGKATSDVWRGGGPAKKVRLEVRIPKSLRKQLRAVAKESGIPVDDLVTEMITTWLGDPRRW